MRNSWLGLTVSLLIGIGFGLAQQLEPKDGLDLPGTDLERVREGSTAPDFTLESKNGAQFTLSSFRGKKNIVLVFYRGYW